MKEIKMYITLPYGPPGCGDNIHEYMWTNSLLQYKHDLFAIFITDISMTLTSQQREQMKETIWNTTSSQFYYYSTKPYPHVTADQANITLKVYPKLVTPV